MYFERKTVIIIIEKYRSTWEQKGGEDGTLSSEIKRSSKMASENNCRGITCNLY